MGKQAPLAQVVERFGSKEKLVDKLMGMLDKGEATKDEFRTRLLAAANSKLLRMHDVHVEITEKFGSKEKLVDAVLELMKRAKDADYREKLLAFSNNRLLDLFRSKKKKAKAA